MSLVSAVFYAFSSLEHLGILLTSIVLNYLIAGRINRSPHWLKIGIALNLSLLVIIKYTSLATATLHDIGLIEKIFNFSLPLAISFYTFHQISFLVDLHRGRVRYPSFLTYVVYVLFFPQLVAGPIVRYHEIAGRLERTNPFPQRWSGLRLGLFFIVCGLAKKVVLADTLGSNVNLALTDIASLTLIEAWLILISFAYQIYFDFSGYTDIAIGIGLLFGIRLPLNFYSPYKAANISEFWRRWHMSLSRFLRDYLYIPLGGNRLGLWRHNVNLMTVMALGGLWHGAGWNFLAWGVLHGLYLIVHRCWRAAVPFALPRPIGMFITFVAVVLAWVPFRAVDHQAALALVQAMVDPTRLALPLRLGEMVRSLPGAANLHFASLPFANLTDIAMVGFVSMLVFLAPNTRQLAIALRGNVLAGFATGLLAAAALIMMLETPLAFVYFRF